MKTIGLFAVLTLALLLIPTSECAGQAAASPLKSLPEKNLPVSGCKITVRLLQPSFPVRSTQAYNVWNMGKPVFLPDQPIWMRVTIQNLQASRLFMPPLFHADEFTFALRDLDTGAVPLTRFGKMRELAGKMPVGTPEAPVVSVSGDIAPVEIYGSMEFDYLLSRRYDMTNGERFEVSASRVLYRADGSYSTVTSNVLPITIDSHYGNRY